MSVGSLRRRFRGIWCIAFPNREKYDTLKNAKNRHSSRDMSGSSKSNVKSAKYADKSAKNADKSAKNAD